MLAMSYRNWSADPNLHKDLYVPCNPGTEETEEADSLVPAAQPA